MGSNPAQAENTLEPLVHLAYHTSTCPGSSIKWTGQRLVTDSGINMLAVSRISILLSSINYNY